MSGGKKRFSGMSSSGGPDPTHPDPAAHMERSYSPQPASRGAAPTIYPPLSGRHRHPLPGGDFRPAPNHPSFSS